MTATVLARRTSAGVKFTLCELLAQLERSWDASCATPARHPRWPIADVYRIVGPLSLTEMAERTGFPERTISRWNAMGYVPDQSADELAIRLELHPCLVWDGFQ